MAFDQHQAAKRFDEFLVLMDDQLDWLRGEAALRGIDLDLTPGDFPKLETLFDQMAEGQEKDAIAGLIVTFSRHLGEILRLNFHGRWHLPLDDPKNVHFDTPVIIGHSPAADLEFAPLAVMRAYALRRKPGTLRRAAEADLFPDPLNLDDLIEEPPHSPGT